MILGWLLACRDDATSYRDALADGACSSLPGGALRDDCYAERGQCEQVEAPLAHDECGFVLAETRGDITLCASAGRFAEDCRMHLWSVAVASWPEGDCELGTAEGGVAPRAAAAGFTVADPPPWSAYFRHCLLRSRPFDRSRCAKVSDAMAREACEQTALAAYNDLLNMARDRKLYPCDGGPLPPLLSYAPDPAIDTLLLGRSDLCPR